MNFYQVFLSELEKDIRGIKYGENIVAYLNELINLEDEFRNILRKYKKGLDVYRKFFDHFSEKNEDVRIAKIYFRERDTFGFGVLFDIIKKRDAEELSKYRINYKFIKWALTQNVPEKKKLNEIYKRIVYLRQRLLTENLPLVVNRSRCFQFKSKDERSDYMDLLQAASEGFLTAIDKFTPEGKIDEKEASRFKSSTMSWMGNKMTSVTNNQMLKMTTKEKYILYRANIARYRLNMEKHEDILKFVQETFPKVTYNQLKDIITSIKISPILSMADSDNFIQNYKVDVENEIEESNVKNKLYDIINKLGALERKIVILKGGLDVSVS
jgi:RNA polymerase sigma factor (sigma-70 family)